MNRLLLVYLHNRLHEDTFLFCESVLANADVISFVNTRVLFWAGDLTNPETFELANLIAPLCYPSTCLFAVKDNSQLKLLDRFDGMVDAVGYVRWLKNSLEKEDARLARSLVQTIEIDQDREIREQQQQEFEQAMQQDLERERTEQLAKLRAENEARERENERIREENRLEAERIKVEDEKRRVREEREQKLKKLPAEPAIGTKNSVALAIRLPDGKQITRRFMESDMMQSVFDFVATQDLYSAGNNKAPITNWEIVTNYPKRTLTNPNETLLQADIKGRAVLFVQEIVA